MGRNSFDMAGDDYEWSGYEYQVPIFVLTHHSPEKSPKARPNQSFTFVSDGVDSAGQQAKAAAGDKDVAVIPGASTTNQVLLAGLADELHIEIMPILLNGQVRALSSPGFGDSQVRRIQVY